MVKKKYIKRFYIEEAFCDECGASLHPTNESLLTYPRQDEYICSNRDCRKRYYFRDGTQPGVVRYEFEEVEDV